MDSTEIGVNYQQGQQPDIETSLSVCVMRAVSRRSAASLPRCWMRDITLKNKENRAAFASICFRLALPRLVYE